MKNQSNPTHQKFVNRYFAFAHLPAALQSVSKPFRELADLLVAKFEENGVDPAELQAGLRKLIEAKDCAVRSFLGDPK